MPNAIPENQNRPQALERLRAQHHLYRQAKNFLVAQLLITLIPPLPWAIAIALLPSLKVWSAFSGLVIALIDAIFLEPMQRRYREDGARVKEVFDCDLLHIPWNPVKAGSRIDPEKIVDAARSFRAKTSDGPLENWYPTSVAALSVTGARLVCQRANISWNSELRTRFARGLIYFAFTVSVLVFGIGLIGGMTLEKFVLAVLAPLTPMILWTVREWNRQTQAAVGLGRLKEYLHGVWDKFIRADMTPDQLIEASRRIQDEIYDRRRLDPVILSYIYRYYRDAQEEQMNRAADEYVDEAIAAGKTNG